jgi:hypothetical protein
MQQMTVLDVIYGLSQAWSSVNPVTLVQSWRKLLTDLENDLQGFPSEEISKVLMRLLETLMSDACVLGFQHMTDIVSAVTNKKCEDEGGDETEIHTAVRKSLSSSQKQAAITNYF